MGRVCPHVPCPKRRRRSGASPVACKPPKTPFASASDLHARAGMASLDALLNPTQPRLTSPVAALTSATTLHTRCRCSTQSTRPVLCCISRRPILPQLILLRAILCRNHQAHARRAPPLFFSPRRRRQYPPPLCSVWAWCSTKVGTHTHTLTNRCSRRQSTTQPPLDA